jgi:hypothetical protein
MIESHSYRSSANMEFIDLLHHHQNHALHLLFRQLPSLWVCLCVCSFRFFSAFTLELCSVALFHRG